MYFLGFGKFKVVQEWIEDSREVEGLLSGQCEHSLRRHLHRSQQRLHVSSVPLITQHLSQEPTQSLTSSLDRQHTTRGVASFAKAWGMDMVCLLTIKLMITVTKGYSMYNIQDKKALNE